MLYSGITELETTSACSLSILTLNGFYRAVEIRGHDRRPLKMVLEAGSVLAALTGCRKTISRWFSVMIIFPQQFLSNIKILNCLSFSVDCKFLFSSPRTIGHWLHNAGGCWLPPAISAALSCCVTASLSSLLCLKWSSLLLRLYFFSNQKLRWISEMFTVLWPVFNLCIFKVFGIIPRLNSVS